MAKRPYKHWEPWEDNILRVKYKTNTAAQIRKNYLPHRTNAAIRSRLTLLSLTEPAKKPTNPPWTEEETKIIKEHYKYKTARQIQAEHLPHRTIYAIRNYASAIGASSRKKSPVNTSKRVRHTRWTEEELNILKANAATATPEELSNLLPAKTARQIHQKSNELGFAKTNTTPWTREELKIITENAEKTTIQQLCALLPNRKRGSIYTKLRALNLTTVQTTTHIFWTESELSILKENIDKSTKDLKNAAPQKRQYNPQRQLPHG